MSNPHKHGSTGVRVHVHGVFMVDRRRVGVEKTFGSEWLRVPSLHSRYVWAGWFTSPKGILLLHVRGFSSSVTIDGHRPRVIVHGCCQTGRCANRCVPL